MRDDDTYDAREARAEHEAEQADAARDHRIATTNRTPTQPTPDSAEVALDEYPHSDALVIAEIADRLALRAATLTDATDGADTLRATMVALGQLTANLPVWATQAGRWAGQGTGTASRALSLALLAEAITEALAAHTDHDTQLLRHTLARISAEAQHRLATDVKEQNVSDEIGRRAAAKIRTRISTLASGPRDDNGDDDDEPTCPHPQDQQYVNPNDCQFYCGACGEWLGR